MKITKIYCDRCDAEIEGNPFMVCINEVDRESEAAVAAQNIARDFCRSCISIISQDIMDAMQPIPDPDTESNAFNAEFSVGSEPEEENKPDPEPEPVKEKKPEPKKTALKQEEKKKPRKTWITEAEKGEIAERYRAGSEPEDIADDMNLLRPQVSRYIYDSGLGKERYGNSCPSGGGAPIPTVMVGGSLTGGSNWY